MSSVKPSLEAVIGDPCRQLTQVPRVQHGLALLGELKKPLTCHHKCLVKLKYNVTLKYSNIKNNQISVKSHFPLPLFS